ncbi:MAG: transposase [Bacteroidota bacterium]
MMKKSSMEQMPIVTTHSAAIDVGSKNHDVAVGQDVAQEVRAFGLYSKDHRAMIAPFNEQGMTCIVMESTGSYWQPLFGALQQVEFEVLFSMSAKTEVKDWVWMQQLPSLG